jgi:hypothetical protein
VSLALAVACQFLIVRQKTAVIGELTFILQVLVYAVANYHCLCYWSRPVKVWRLIIII